MALLIEELAHTELLREVSKETLNKVLGHGSLVELSHGQVLLSPEATNHHLYLVLSGTLTVHFASPDSSAIREVNTGYSVGELSIIDDSAPSAYVKAKGVTRVFPIHRDFLLDLIQNTHPIAYNLLRLLTLWMKSNTQKIINDQSKILELASQANIDSLTGLYNRRWLENALPRMVEQTARSGQPLVVLIIDVDHFKKYNEQQGHLGGDIALITMANVLKTNVRSYDYVARIGGEEFMVILPNTSRIDGLALAERIRQETEEQKIIDHEGVHMPGITVSIGLAQCEEGSTASSLFSVADKQLYLAKNSGRNCVK